MVCKIFPRVFKLPLTTTKDAKKMGCPDRAALRSRLVAVVVPGILIAFAGKEGMSFHRALEVFRDWFFWISFAVLVAGQALLLLLPIDISDRRLTPRRPLKLPVIVTGFFSLLCAAFKDNGFAAIDPVYTFNAIKNAIAHNDQPAGTDGPSGWGFWLGAIGMIVIF